MVTKLESTIYSRNVIAADTVEIVFDASKDHFDFVAGQYMTIVVHGLESFDIREQFRDFSIASSPTQPEKLAVVFRVSQSRFKQLLLQAPLGTPITIEGPKGVFTLPDASNKQLVFIAGGIGIAPFLSMIRFAAETRSPHRIALFYYNNDKESAAYFSELEEISKRHESFSFFPIFGPLGGDEIGEYISKQDIANLLFYIAGPPGMVTAARSLLMTKGIRDDTIKTEEFSGYKI